MEKLAEAVETGRELDTVDVRIRCCKLSTNLKRFTKIFNALLIGFQLATDHTPPSDALAATAVDEIVRWASPVIWMRRTLASPAVLSGVELAQGDKVLLFYNSANRDPLAFIDPDRFDLARDPNPHVGFGAPGPHFCLGAHLARREIKVMWRELFERFPQISATAEPDRLRSNFINGIKHLPCSITPAP